MTRAATRTPIHGANPPIRSPTEKSPIPIAKGRARLPRSMRMPAATMPRRLPRKNPEKTHPYRSRPPSSWATIGMIVETASASDATMVPLRTRPRVSARRELDQRPSSASLGCGSGGASRAAPRSSVVALAIATGCPSSIEFGRERRSPSATLCVVTTLRDASSRGGAAPTSPPLRGTVEAIHLTPVGGAPMMAVQRAAAKAGIGLEGDRYALRVGHYSPDPRVDRQITLVAAEEIERLADVFDIHLPPGATRRNVTTRGLDVNALNGRRFRIGTVLCEGTRLCEPCLY